MADFIGGLFVGMSAVALVLAALTLWLGPEEPEELGAWQDSDPRTVRGIDGEKLRRPK